MRGPRAIARPAAKGHGAVNNPLTQVDPGLYIWTIVTFLVLLALLTKFAWKPLLAALEIIVVLVQAYVFTLLSAVFIGMAIHAHH